MKKIYLFFVSGILIFACSQQVDPGDKYGADITLTDKTEIATILAIPDKYVGKTVLVSGKVEDVCPMKGCWIDITGANPDEKIRVKVEDDVIVFPQSAKGRVALVEGEVEKLEMTKEEVIASEKHHAEEMGEDFDESSVTEGKTVYRLKGIAAVIKTD
ncbi:MAG: DUF4920 domain-containing protein [bacterium]